MPGDDMRQIIAEVEARLQKADENLEQRLRQVEVTQIENSARYAQLEKNIDDLSRRLEKNIENLSKMMEKGFEKVDEHFREIAKRFWWFALTIGGAAIAYAVNWALSGGMAIGGS